MADLLLVDNDERLLELVGWLLGREGHAVRTAPSYAAARERIAERRPDLMLADLDLGAESGREELPRLAAQGLLPRTLVVSGYLDATLDEELRAVPGVVGTLAKPFDPQAIGPRIEACLAAPAPPEREHVLHPPAAGGAPPAEEPARTDAAQEDDDGWVEIRPLGGARGGGDA